MLFAFIGCNKLKNVAFKPENKELVLTIERQNAPKNLLNLLI